MLHHPSLTTRHAAGCRYAPCYLLNKHITSTIHVSVSSQTSTGQSNAATSSAVVTIFTTPGCQYCKKAKLTLSEQSVAFQEVDVSASSELRQALLQATGQRTVPQVFVNDSLVGGSDDLTAAISSGSFASLLQPTSSPQLLPSPLQAALQSATQTGRVEPISPSGLQVPPELQQLVELLADKAQGITQSSPSGGVGYPGAFTGRTLVDWLKAHSSSDGSREAAVTLAQQLLSCNIVTVVAQQQPSAADLIICDDNTHWYRLRVNAPRELPWGVALNTGYWWGPAPARPPGVVAEELRRRILSLYDKYLSPDGKSVRYKALKQDPAFWEYVDATAELQRVDLSGLAREELMSFAINLYNALCIHTLVVHGPDKYNSFLGRLEFFRKAARYNIGGSDYVLDDLENGVLRGNAPGAATLGMLLKLPQLSSGPFRQGDPRAQHVVSPVDPRIHFALVCGAVSCPPIKLYTPDTLDEGLTAAAEAFCASEVEVDVAAKQVKMSNIFGWYYPDFGPDAGARLRFLLPYLPAVQHSQLEQLLAADPEARRIQVRYTPYDWTINAAEE